MAHVTGKPGGHPGLRAAVTQVSEVRGALVSLPSGLGLLTAVSLWQRVLWSEQELGITQPDLGSGPTFTSSGIWAMLAHCFVRTDEIRACRAPATEQTHSRRARYHVTSLSLHVRPGVGFIACQVQIYQEREGSSLRSVSPNPWSS